MIAWHHALKRVQLQPFYDQFIVIHAHRLLLRRLTAQDAHTANLGDACLGRAFESIGQKENYLFPQNTKGMSRGREINNLGIVHHSH